MPYPQIDIDETVKAFISRYIEVRTGYITHVSTIRDAYYQYARTTKGKNKLFKAIVELSEDAYKRDSYFRNIKIRIVELLSPERREEQRHEMAMLQIKCDKEFKISEIEINHAARKQLNELKLRELDLKIAQVNLEALRLTTNQAASECKKQSIIEQPISSNAATASSSSVDDESEYYSEDDHCYTKPAPVVEVNTCTEPRTSTVSDNSYYSNDQKQSAPVEVSTYVEPRKEPVNTRTSTVSDNSYYSNDRYQSAPVEVNTRVPYVSDNSCYSNDQKQSAPVEVSTYVEPRKEPINTQFCPISQYYDDYESDDDMHVFSTPVKKDPRYADVVIDPNEPYSNIKREILDAESDDEYYSSDEDRPIKSWREDLLHRPLTDEDFSYKEWYRTAMEKIRADSKPKF